MPCFHPIKGWRASQPNKEGKYPVHFSPNGYSDPDKAITIPCGQCIGCRLERSRQWAMRCVHEASLYALNCFITLTYDDEHLPKDGGLCKRDYQLFFKRLRKAYDGDKQIWSEKKQKFIKPIRYYMCGEYGNVYTTDGRKCVSASGRDLIGRPHFHACIFNFDFTDRKLWRIRDGVRLYRSESLEKIWGNGFCSIGDVTFESAAYVARYVTKKLTGVNTDEQREHYCKVDESTGEWFPVLPEYTDMSRNPGIAHNWYTKYKGDLDKDFITLRGLRMRPAKYYDSLLETEDKEVFEARKKARIEKAYLQFDEQSPRRLAVKERLTIKRATKLVRLIE